MAWIYQIDNLKPYMPGNVGSRTIVTPLPLTPFWWQPATAGQKRGVALDGKDFFPQHTTTYPTDADFNHNPTKVCGFKSYRQMHTTWDYEGDCLSYYLDGYKTTTYFYDFSVNGTRQVSIAEENIEPGFFLRARSATYATLRDEPYPRGGGSPQCTLVMDSTFSNEVDLTWMQGQIGVWQASSNADKTASNNNTSSSLLTESNHGWRLRVSFHEIKPQGYWFSGPASGMTGDIGTRWNGNFWTYLVKETRKNYPRIWNTDNGSSSIQNATVGEQCYKEGYHEAELSEDISDLWKDNYGEYNFGGGDDWDIALASRPYMPIGLSGSPAGQSWLLTYYAGGESTGSANELVIASSSGQRYRITLQITEDSYTPDWSSSTSITLITDPDTQRVTHRFGPDAQFKSLRVQKIDVWENDDWELLADTTDWDAWRVIEDKHVLALENYYTAWYEWYDGGQIGPEPAEPENNNGPEPTSPGSLITSSPLTSDHLFALFKYRDGVKFGFPPLTGGGSARYRRRTYRKHLIPGTVDAPEGTCGATSIAGALDLEYTQIYLDGELQPKEILQWSAVMAGQDWTPDDWVPFDVIANSGTTNTPTLRRIDTTGPEVPKYLHGVAMAFDSPSVSGKLIATTTELVPLTISGTTNIASDFLPIPVPAAGQSTFSHHRLTPAPPPLP